QVALPQPIFVAADVLLHPAAAYEYERAEDDVIEERAIVRDEKQRAGPFDELFFDELQRLEIEIVGRLVEHEDVRGPREQPREQQAVPLAARQRSNRRSRALV